MSKFGDRAYQEIAAHVPPGGKLRKKVSIQVNPRDRDEAQEQQPTDVNGWLRRQVEIAAVVAGRRTYVDWAKNQVGELIVVSPWAPNERVS